MKPQPGAAKAEGRSTTASLDRKSTQRERLLTGMLHVAATEGYAGATIAKVIGHAVVSRPTFYEYFADKEQCFLAVLANVQDEALTEIRHAVEASPAERAAVAALGGLAEFVQSQPAAGRLLVKESLAGGRRALELRDEGIARVEQLIDDRYATLAPATAIADVSSAMLVGGLQRLIASRLRRDDAELVRLVDELVAWVESYKTPLSRHRWRALEPVHAPSPSPFLSPLLEPAPLPPGRPKLSRKQVAEIHRQRILFAAAEISERKGYAGATIREISHSAGVDGRVLHGLFANKDELFIALHELHFQRLMAVSVSAFFTGESWPDRVWEAGRAFAGSVEEVRALARASFIESHAEGPIALERVEEVVGAFKIFLQEGYQYSEPSQATSPVALEAITATIFEILYTQARRGPKPDIAGLLPHVTSLALTPFLGPAAANAFIDAKIAEQCT
jgi:AcrR family transcriptional regulator